jgi:dienelactone hydrolase
VEGQMKKILAVLMIGLGLGFAPAVSAQGPEKTVDIPTRPGVTQRFLYLAPENPRAALILFAGGNGGLQISPSGAIGWGKSNFLVRTRNLFAEKGLSVAVIDAPSDRQNAPFLGGFRQKAEHVEDVKALIAWLRKQHPVPVWLVGTSRGTQSAAFVATELGVQEGGPDGLVLTSTMLSDDKGRPVPEMTLGKIAIPVLVVHHEQDGCRHCAYGKVPALMEALTAAPRKGLIAVQGGVSKGDPCEALAYHGFNGVEKDVVSRISEWIP